MPYAIAIAVGLAGMYVVLAHKDRELAGRAPHYWIRSFRDALDRLVEWFAVRATHNTKRAAQASARATRDICVGGGKLCARCCEVAWDASMKGVKRVARASRAAARRVAHPSTRDDSATLAQR